MKADEYRNVTLFFIPIVVDLVQDSNDSERDMWLLLGCTVRALILPEIDFDFEQEEENLRMLMHRFTTIHETVFGVEKSTYNLHLFEHFAEIRADHGPLTETSAFWFESYYAEFKRAYVQGTMSTAKHAMKNLFLKQYTKHKCRRKVQVICKERKRTDDTIVYTQDLNFFKVFEESEGGYLAKGIVKEEWNCQLQNHITLSFGKVGAFKSDMEVTNDLTHLPKESIIGKGIHISNVILAIPQNIINE